MHFWSHNVNYQMIIQIHLVATLSVWNICTDARKLQQKHLAYIIAHYYATISILWFSHITICHLISIIALGVLLTNRLKWALISWIGWSKRCSAMWMVIVNVKVLQRKIITMNGVLHEIFSQMQTEISTSVKVMITTNSYYGI